jgi:N6-L-threonylcarbamoyladenine synthase
VSVRILGIESSCDETAAAIVEDGTRILSSVVASQIATHQPYGGVVPELASREHLRAIAPTVEAAANEAGVILSPASERGLKLDAVAVTSGPGLVGSLLVGLTYAKALALSLGLPLIGVNHLEGHVYAVMLEQIRQNTPAIDFPAIALVVSGGHTMTFLVEPAVTNGAPAASAGFRYTVLGRTRDDAAGEAFDKVAKLLALGYPGGPVIDRLAPHGNPHAVTFTVPRIKGNSLDFSFSGIKTAVLRYVQSHDMAAEIERRAEWLKTEPKPSTEAFLERCSQRTLDLVASFREAVVEDLVTRTIAAAQTHDVRAVVVSGGVACNARLRERFRQLPRAQALPAFFPSPALSTDNAAMIAAAAFPKFLRRDFAGFDLRADAALPLHHREP